MLNLKVILLLYLSLNLLIACTIPTPTTSLSDSSEEQNLTKNSGVKTISMTELPPLTTGQIIYVPIYSEIYDFNPNRAFQLTATLSLRNTDLSNSIVIETVDYYNSEGKKLKAYLTDPIQLDPLASTEVVVAKDDKVGGVGANFIVEWRAANEVSDPVVEAVMVSTISQQGMSFVSSGKVIRERQDRLE